MPADAAEIVRLAERVQQAGKEGYFLFRDIQEALVGWMTYDQQARFLGFTQERAWLDAAMELVPGGHFVDLMSHEEGWDATVGWVDQPCRSTTPALALAAAALKARARAQHDHEVG